MVYLDHTLGKRDELDELYVSEAARTWYMREKFACVSRLATKEQAQEMRLEYLNNQREIGSKKPTLVPIQPPPFAREHFFPIIPSRTLWGYLGTMTFAAWRSRHLMRLGYMNTLDQLRAGIYAPATQRPAQSP